MIKSMLLVLPLLCGPVSAWATDFNDQSLCSALTTATTKKDHMDMRRAGAYIESALRDMDRKMVAGGHQSLIAIISQTELLHMIGDTSAMCQQEPTMLIYDAAKGVYVTASMFSPG
jgi:hypothetical protein